MHVPSQPCVFSCYRCLLRVAAVVRMSACCCPVVSHHHHLGVGRIGGQVEKLNISKWALCKNYLKRKCQSVSNARQAAHAAVESCKVS